MQDRPEVAVPWRYRIGIAEPIHRTAVEAVRRAAYRQALEFDWIDDAMLGWCTADDTGTVLGLWDNQGTLLSTVRATIFSNAEQAEAFLQYSLSSHPIATPTLVLSRAATTPAAARQGLNSLLRYAYLTATAAMSIGSVITIVYEGGPRLGSMRAAGFEFLEPSSGWDSEAVARTRALLAWLPRERLDRGIHTMTTTLAQPLEDVHIETASIVRALLSQCEMADNMTNPGSFIRSSG